jgi:hypothetical protein
MLSIRMLEQSDFKALKAIRLIIFSCLLVFSTTSLGMSNDVIRLQVSPTSVQFLTPESTQQLLITAIYPNGDSKDVTREVTYIPCDSGIAGVSKNGQVRPFADGQTQLRIQLGQQELQLPITVAAFASPPSVSFRQHIIPILSKAGCNSGGCHGKAEGQQGFRLSVFGYDAEADYQAIALHGRGRRIFPTSPEHSLIRQKAIAEVPHGGGKKIEPGSLWDQILLRWIAEGAKLDPLVVSAPPIPEVTASQPNTSLEHLEVEPPEIILPAKGQQQLRITFIDKQGNKSCVTADAQYQSNEDTIAVVDNSGLISTTENPGEAAILIRYLGTIAVCRVTRPRDALEFAAPTPNNFIDSLVWKKLQRLNIHPSSLADEATFLRRAYLDTIGTLPTASEASAYLEDPDVEKRSRLIVELLKRPEYADYWAQRWSDLLQVDKDTIPPASAVAMTRWIHTQIAENVPYDQFANTILTAEGSIFNESPAPFYQVHSDPEKLARSVSQLFLGVRIECAQCHHHPMERWDQKDYYALAGFFTGLERKASPITGTKIVAISGRDLIHPRTQQTVPAAVLGGAPADFAANLDRRRIFATWMTDSANPYFTKLIVNRLWAHYMGRGLIEPIDDIRDTNPASNEELLDALVKHLQDLRFDLKKFTQSLLESKTYQLSHVPDQSNRLDQQNYSHSRWKPIAAEVLLDAVSQVTDVPEVFNGWPVGYRAIQVWDNKLPSHFLEVFGRPRRLTVCACERGSEPSMEQALHLMNATATAEKISHPEGRIKRLADSALTPEEIIIELYLTALSRFPTDDEKTRTLVHFGTTATRQEAIEDVVWVLLNTREFVFNH